MNETRRCEDEGPLLPCLGANAPCNRGGGETAVAGVGSGEGTRGATSGGGSAGEVSNGVARGGKMFRQRWLQRRRARRDRRVGAGGEVGRAGGETDGPGLARGRGCRLRSIPGRKSD